MNSPAANSDVRMRGFLKRTPVAECLAWVDAHSAPVRIESVELARAPGRVLARDVQAPIDVPGFDRSAMDGYALRSEETSGAGDYQPITLRIVGEAMPGAPWEGMVEAGKAVRIMTGAPMPAGADAVVPAEFATPSGEAVEIRTAVPARKNVGLVGEDIRAGGTILSRGRRLRPQDVAVIASIGISRIEVHARPAIRIIVTGNELVPPGVPKGAHQIYEANSFLLRGLVNRDGGTLESVRFLRDDPQDIRDALTASGADAVLVSGGSSVGREDHAPRLVADAGELAIHGVAMRPSSPAGMGRIGTALVFLLPGNPVSCLCAYDFFAGRAIRRLQGLPAGWPYQAAQLPLARKLVSEVGRTDYCRVRITPSGVEPLALSGASILSSTTRADGFVVVPDTLEGYSPGSSVEVRLYDSVA
jgi:molybdopterin molybdotransferase